MGGLRLTTILRQQWWPNPRRCLIISQFILTVALLFSPDMEGGVGGYCMLLGGVFIFYLFVFL